MNSALPRRASARRAGARRNVVLTQCFIRVSPSDACIYHTDKLMASAQIIPIDRG
ncbi:protein of unknown function [Methylorubrum extorquens]|uniref:Uncharacterized protein n=1 Tax=Methylorubrum extorquens TaxID=408 RepID=A0A2N9AJH5_METEX|nr:protein of unknown function [Methylorubrum extorquens]